MSCLGEWRIRMDEAFISGSVVDLWDNGPLLRVNQQLGFEGFLGISTTTRICVNYFFFCSSVLAVRCV